MRAEVPRARIAARWGTHLPEGDLRIMRQRLDRDGAIELCGEQGAGRERVALELLRRPLDSEDLVVLRSWKAASGAPYSLLSPFLAELAPDMAPDRVVRSANVPRLLIVHDAQLADPMSLRVLGLLARSRRAAIVLIVTGAAVPFPEFGPIATYSVPRMTPDDVAVLVGNRFGANVLPGDAAALHRESDGNHRALRWLVDRAQASANVRLFSSTLFFVPVPADEDAPWRLARLESAELERLVAFAGELPVPWARAAYGEQELIRTLEKGDLMAAGGQLRFKTPAQRIEIIARAIPERRRWDVRRLLEDARLLSPTSDLTDDAAAQLVDAAGESGLSVPVELVRRARSGYLAVRRPAAALPLALTDDPPVRERLDHALVHALAGEVVVLVDVLWQDMDPDELLELGVILVIAELRDGGPSVADLLDAFERRLPDGFAAVLCAFRVATGHPRRFDGDALNAALETGTEIARSFALRCFAVRELMLARPETAALHLAAARGIVILPVHRRIDEVIAMLVALLSPGSDRRLGPEHDASPPGLVPTLDLLAAMRALFCGDAETAVALAHAAVQGADREGSIMAPLLHGVASLAFSLLDRPDRALHHLDRLRAAPESPPSVRIGRLFFEGRALLQLDFARTRSREAVRLLAEAGDVADEIGYRSFAIFSRLCAIAAADEALKGTLLRQVIEAAHAAPAVEGVFRLRKRRAEALRDDDSRALAEIAVDARAQGLLFDAVALSTSLAHAEGEFPRALQRAIKKLSKHRFGFDADRTGLGQLLTSREVEIALLAVDGLTDREIGRRLNIARTTASTHMVRILRKLGISSRTRIHDVLQDPSMDRRGPTW